MCGTSPSATNSIFPRIVTGGRTPARTRDPRPPYGAFHAGTGSARLGRRGRQKAARHRDACATLKRRRATRPQKVILCPARKALNSSSWRIRVATPRPDCGSAPRECTSTPWHSGAMPISHSGCRPTPPNWSNGQLRWRRAERHSWTVSSRNSGAARPHLRARPPARRFTTNGRFTTNVSDRAADTSHHAANIRIERACPVRPPRVRSRARG